MLRSFGLAKKILSFNADNATSNDTQTTKLASLPNSFEEENRARCFNHTVQLSAKELIKPFNAGMGARQASDGDNSLILEDIGDNSNGDEDEDDMGDEDEDDTDDEDKDNADDEDDNINEIDEMTDEEREEIAADTAIVRETVTKVD
jgi:hypothetical protein